MNVGGRSMSKLQARHTIASHFQRERITSEFLNLTFAAANNDVEYKINFDQLSEGEEEDQFTGKFRVRSRSLPARISQEESMSSQRSSSNGDPHASARTSRATGHIPASHRHSTRDTHRQSVDEGCANVFTLASSEQDGVQNSRKASTRSSAGGPGAIAPLQRTSHAQSAQETPSSGCSQTEGSEIWNNKTGEVRRLRKSSRKESSKALRPALRSSTRDIKAEFCITVQPQTVTGHGHGEAEPPQVEVRTWGPDTEGPISHGSVVWARGETMEISAAAGESELHFEVCKVDRGEACPPEGSVHAKVMLSDVSGSFARRSMPLDSSVLPGFPGACLVADITKTRLQAAQAAGVGSVKKTKTGLTWHPNVQETRSFQGDRGSRRNTPFLPADPPIQEAEEKQQLVKQTRTPAQPEDARSSKTDCSNLSQPISMQLDLPETQRISKLRGQAPGNHSNSRIDAAEVFTPSPEDASQVRASVSKDSQPSSTSSSQEPLRHRSSSQRWRVFHGHEKDSWRDPIRRSKSQPAHDDLTEKSTKQHADAQSKEDLRQSQQAPMHMLVDASDNASSSQHASLDEPEPVAELRARKSARSSDAKQSRAWRLSAPPRRTQSMVEAEALSDSASGHRAAFASAEPAEPGSERALSDIQGSCRLRSSGVLGHAGHVDGTSKPSGHCASDSRGSRLSNRSNRAQSQTYLQRFTCRYTEPRAVTFSGLCQEHRCFVTNCAEGLLGRDRTALLVLLEQAEHSVAAVRRHHSSADAATMPRLLASLSAEFVLHARELREGHLKTICEEPVVLVVLQRLIEVLDTLVPVGGGTADAVACCFREPRYLHHGR